MGISEMLVEKLQESGVVTPTPIQEQAIPYVMKGNDIIAQAQTGTGKTFAFILPILEHLDPEASHVQALIVTPTRELALQITGEFKKLINDLPGIDVLAVYGGQDVDKQLKKLKKNVQIVVSTPGRLLDHIRRGTVNLSEISSLVLDEADQMLQIGFLNEVEEIIDQTPASRQTMLFSATMPPEIRTLARKHMREPKYIQVEKTQGPAQTVNQLAIHTVDRAKQATLIGLIEAHRPFLAVIFCRTKRRVSKLYEALRSHGYKCDELHGDLSQAKREQVMKRFRDAEVQLLIATDVAARGLDVEGVTHVYNYDIPLDSESYIHRIGRTGRAGMTGMAITLYASKDRPLLDLIEKELNLSIEKQNLGNMEKTDDETVDRPNRSSSSQMERRGNRKGRSGRTEGPRRQGDKRSNKFEDPNITRDRRGNLLKDSRSRTEVKGKKSEVPRQPRDRNEVRSEGARPARNRNEGARPQRSRNEAKSADSRPQRSRNEVKSADSRPQRSRNEVKSADSRPQRSRNEVKSAGSSPSRGRNEVKSQISRPSKKRNDFKSQGPNNR
ncbi:ATP-dependent RNA helicase [Bacillus sp. 1NLA3E]|nr:ATP-dependent RNA helicase [Bacillus sp. 1NLA3E]